ncbi:MAG: decarboxylase [Pseudomonadota bacterium]
MVEERVLRGAAIIDAIKKSGVEFVVSVPDIVTSENVLWPLASDPHLRLIRVCKEDEGISICTGLAFCDRRALLLIQNTGLFDSINALRGIGVEYQQPVCMMVGLQGKEPDLLPSQSAKYSVRIVEPILDAMRVEHHLIQAGADVAKIGPAIDQAYASSRPVVFLIGRSPA